MANYETYLKDNQNREQVAPCAAVLIGLVPDLQVALDYQCYWEVDLHLTAAAVAVVAVAAVEVSHKSLQIRKDWDLLRHQYQHRPSPDGDAACTFDWAGTEVGAAVRFAVDKVVYMVACRAVAEAWVADRLLASQN